MPGIDATESELQERLEETNAQLEALQASLADAEARAATLEERAAQAEANSAQWSEAAKELETAQARLRDAAARYRTARLEAHPDIPPDMVTEAEDIDEIERQVAAAERVVGQLKERLATENAVKAPAGSPARRSGPDLSGLSPAEKIRLGLQTR